MIARVSVAFARFRDSELVIFANTVVKEMTGNAAFPSPPVALAHIEAGVDDLSSKHAAAAMGGRVQTAEKAKAGESLIALLRVLAAYVQAHCGNSMTTLLSSGFQAASTNRTQTDLERPEGVTVRNGGEGELIASFEPIRNRAIYEGRIRQENDGSWLPSEFSRDSRRLLFKGLVPGAKYEIQVRALGGSTGKSEWSDPTFHRSL